VPDNVELKLTRNSLHGAAVVSALWNCVSICLIAWVFEDGNETITFSGLNLGFPIFLASLGCLAG
jgi:hypothetical protein